MKKLEQTEYTVKLHEGVKTLVFIYFLNPKLISSFNKEEIIDYIISDLKIKENRKYYILAADLVEQINKKEYDYDLSTFRNEIVQMCILEMIEKTGMLYMENTLYNMVDRVTSNNKYLISERTLRYLDEQLYPKIMYSCYQIIYDALIRLINPVYNIKYISITNKTADLLYNDDEKKIDKLLEDLSMWIKYNNLDYFLKIEKTYEKIYIKVKLKNIFSQ